MGKKNKKQNTKTQNQNQNHKKDKNYRNRGRKNERLSKSFDLLMKQQLSQFGLDFKEITGDGNCMFRAISDQMVGGEDMHDQYRSLSISFMRDNREDFAPFVEDDEDFSHYIRRMSQSGTWGGNLELQALSQVLQVNIKIHILGSPVWEIMNWPGSRWIHLSYHEESHYNSVRLKGDMGDDIPNEIPEFNDIVETTEENKEKLFDFFANYFVDTFQEGEVKQVAWALKRIYKNVPGFDEICYGYDRIVQEMEEFREEEKKEEPVKKEIGKGKGKEMKRPAKLPNNKDKCWCGSGKIYKKCCKPYDHLREVEVEEEKIVTKMNSLQI